MLPKIVIHTDADLTPRGKRAARVVPTLRGGKVLRWYVGGRIYRQLAPNAANADLTRRWIEAGTARR